MTAYLSMLFHYLSNTSLIQLINLIPSYHHTILRLFNLFYCMYWNVCFCDFAAATLPVSCARGAKVGADGKRAVGDVVEAYVPNVGGAGFAQGWLQAKVVKVFVNGKLVFFSTSKKESTIL